MGVVIDNIEEIAMVLPSESRVRLAGMLIESLDPDSESQELREARITELRRRVSEIKLGTAKFINADTAFKKIDELLAR
ncbi:MAG: addiction module protein [Pyrinomonadaceae bacterium]